jgi:hypothetical protein
MKCFSLTSRSRISIKVVFTEILCNVQCCQDLSPGLSFAAGGVLIKLYPRGFQASHHNALISGLFVVWHLVTVEWLAPLTITGLDWMLYVFCLQDSVKHFPELARGFRVADPDPDPNWIRIQSGQWIRMRIRNPDPDPGGQIWPTKVAKKSEIHVLKCWMFSFESWRLLLYLGRPLFRPRYR